MPEGNTHSGNWRGFVCWLPPPTKPRRVGCSPPLSPPDRSTAAEPGFLREAPWVLQLRGHRPRHSPATRVGNLTRDEVVDNTTLTGVTNTGISSGRLYWESDLGVFLYWESDLGLFDIKAATAGA